MGNHYALRADNALADGVRAPGILLAIARQAQTVAKVEIDREIRKSVPVRRRRQIRAPAAETADIYGHTLVAQRPHNHVDIVDVLLDYIVAGCPNKRRPVADLVLYVVGFEPVEYSAFREIVVQRLPDVVRAEPEALRGDDFADFTVLNTLYDVAISLVIAALGAADHAESLFLCLGGNREHFARLRYVDTRGFFEERVPARRNDFRIVRSAEDGRRGVDYQIDIFGEKLVDAVPTCEFFYPIGIDNVGRLGRIELFGVVGNLFYRVGVLVGKQIGNRNDCNVFVRRNHIAYRRRPPAAAAHQADFYTVAPEYAGETEFRQSRCR